jgi:TonB family protein
MQVRRVCAAAGAVTINLLAAAGLLSMASPAIRPPSSPEPIVARLIEPAEPPPAAVEPVRPPDRAPAARDAPERTSAAREAVHRVTAPPDQLRAPQAANRVVSSRNGGAIAIDASAVSTPAVAATDTATATPATATPATATPATATAAADATATATAAADTTATDRRQSGLLPTAVAVAGAGAAAQQAWGMALGPSDPRFPGAGEPSDRAAGGPARQGPRVDASWTGNVAPLYPGAARRLGEQGEVRLDVHVGADGTVLEVRLRRSSGSTTLDRSAIDTVRRWRFTPARVDGQAIDAWYRDWTWTFRLEG